jgi:ABC-type glutathione transport system ATPase component
MADVEKLIHVLHRLVGAGNTAVVVEHNLDVMAEADWILDMGPEAGEGGGKIVAQGTPAQIVKRKKESHTGRVLEGFLRERTSDATPKPAARLASPAATNQPEAVGAARKAVARATAARSTSAASKQSEASAVAASAAVAPNTKPKRKVRAVTSAARTKAPATKRGAAKRTASRTRR